MSTAAYTVSDDPADPETAALELIVRIPAEVPGHDSPPRDALQDFRVTTARRGCTAAAGRHLIAIKSRGRSPRQTMPTELSSLLRRRKNLMVQVVIPVTKKLNQMRKSRTGPRGYLTLFDRRARSGRR
jgi:hypothetical protein